MSRSFCDATENDVLNWLVGTTGYTPHPSNLVLRLSTTLPTEGGVITEPSGGGYAEQAIAFGAASSGVVSNSGVITFPTATAPWGNIIGWAVRDTVASKTIVTGNMASYFDRIWRVFGTTDTIQVLSTAAPATDTRVFFSVRDSDGSFVGDLSSTPYGFADWEMGDFTGVFQEYWVVNSSSDTFQIALTRGGAPVDLADITGFRYGDISIWAANTKVVSAGDQISFPVGSITIALK